MCEALCSTKQQLRVVCALPSSGRWLEQDDAASIHLHHRQQHSGVKAVVKGTEIEWHVAPVQHQPAELYDAYATIEYQVPANNVMPPSFVFIIDTSVAEDELRACVASLSQALTTLPEYTQVSAGSCISLPAGTGIHAQYESRILPVI